MADYGSGLQIIDISTPSSPTLVGTYNTPGEARRVVVVGSYAYVADRASGLQIIDISTPSSPTFVGSYNTSGSAYDVVVVGNYAYVADYNFGLQIIDISTPSTPVWVGSYSTGGYAYGIDVVGNYAYMARDTSGLQIIDISTPSSPTLVGSYSTGTTDAWDVEVVGNYAYVADETSGLKIIDISNPSSPTLVGTHGVLAHGVTVVGDYAYMAVYASSLQIIDISNPSSPTLVATYNIPSNTYSVAVEGNCAYVAGSTSGLKIIEVNNGLVLSGTPSILDNGMLYLKATASDGSGEVSDEFNIDVLNEAPTVVDPVLDQNTDHGQLFDMTLLTHDIFRDLDGDLLNMTISQSDDSDLPAWLTATDKSFSPALIGSYNTLGSSCGVAVVGNYAYVADYGPGLQIIDTSTPSSPTLVGTCDTPASALDVAVVGNYAYVADYPSGLQIIDISTPSSPALVGTYNTSANAQRVAVVGNYAYVADYPNGLKVIDISTPSSPTLAGTYDTPGNAYGVAVVGNYAYVADYASGLQIIDISTPSSPTLVGTCNTPGGAIDVVIVGNYAYVADYGAGLQIIDISTPSNPTLVGAYDTPDLAYGIAVLGNYAYLADQSSGLHIIDISTPSSPTLAWSYDTSGDARGVAVAGDYAYVADYDFGLQIFTGVGRGLLLSGTPSVTDTGMLYLKTAVSDGVEGVSDEFSIDVLNEAPTVDAVSKWETEDTAVTFSASDFTSHFSDADGDTLTKIQILSLPSNGVLKLSGVDVSLNQEINSVGLGNLTFEPSANWHGDTSFNWQGSDGNMYSSNTASVDIQIGPVQDPPIVSDISKAGTEDTIVTFSASDFTSRFSDADGDTLTKIQILSLPSNGVLKFSGADVSLNQEINSINLGSLTFEPSASWSGDTSFNWQGSDGTDYSSNTANVNINIAPVQNIPTVSDVSRSGTEDTRLTFSVSNFANQFTDIDGEDLAGVRVVTLPNNGVLKFSESDVVVDQEINVGDLVDLTFDPNRDWYGDTSFRWKGSDGTDYSSNTADVLITIAEDTSNRVPTITGFDKGGTRNKMLNFEASDFTDSFNDADGDSLVQIQIVGLPENGVLKLSGVNVEVDQEIPVEELDSLTFVPESEWFGETNFGWRADDGKDYSNPHTVTINISESAAFSWNTFGAVVGSITGVVGAIAAVAAVVVAIPCIAKKCDVKDNGGSIELESNSDPGASGSSAAITPTPGSSTPTSSGGSSSTTSAPTSGSSTSSSTGGSSTTASVSGGGGSSGGTCSSGSASAGSTATAQSTSSTGSSV